MTDTAKQELRAAAKERRRAAAAGSPQDVAEIAADHFLDCLQPKPGAVVSGYWPVRDELDPRPLMRRLIECGCICALPVVVAAGRPLVFRAWSPGAEMRDAVLGIPVPSEQASTVRPDLLLVPLLAFCSLGYRLGYGGGYYDRTLADLRRQSNTVLAVGFAYSDQEFEAVPHDDTDERLDWVVTEREARSLK